MTPDESTGASLPDRRTARAGGDFRTRSHPSDSRPCPTGPPLKVGTDRQVPDGPPSDSPGRPMVCGGIDELVLGRSTAAL